MPRGQHFPGFGLTGFRSFGTKELQFVGPMSKVHLLAGPNNSGKSNVLRVAERVFPSLRGDANLDLSVLDIPLVPEEVGHSELRVSIPYRAAASDFEIAVGAEPFLRQLLSGSTFGSDGQLLWFEFQFQASGWRTTDRQVADVATAGSRPTGGGGNILDVLAQRLTTVQGGGVGADAGRIMDRIVAGWQVLQSIPQVASIGPVRQITSGSQDYNGSGLIERLQQL